MIIHVVREGDTLSSIAQTYGVPSEQILRENELSHPEPLVPGQDLIIQYTAVTHIIQPGETLYTIATLYNVSVIQLLQNNPGLANATRLLPGQVITIEYTNQKMGRISITGCAYPYINRSTLLKTLPYLTYLNLFTYGFTLTGDLIAIDDTAIIRLAREYGVAPIMLLTTLTKEGIFSDILGHSLLTSPALQETLIANIRRNMKEKNYYGLEVNFEFLYEEDQDNFTTFVTRLTEQLNGDGFQVIVALPPKMSNRKQSHDATPHDYPSLADVADNLLLMTYEWGYSYGTPMAVAPIDKVRRVISYGTEVIPSQKVFMGIPCYGYDWNVPYQKGENVAKSLIHSDVLTLARKYNASIQYDHQAQTPYLNYRDSMGQEHEVWFENARSIQAKLHLILKFKLQGASYWNIMQYFPQNWLVTNALMDINKVL